MYKVTEISNDASDFKVGDTVRFYTPNAGTVCWESKTAVYSVGTGVITKAYISRETEPSHFGRGSVKGATWGATCFEIETEAVYTLANDGSVVPYRAWKQKRVVVMGMPFGGLAK